MVLLCPYRITKKKPSLMNCQNFQGPAMFFISLICHNIPANPILTIVLPVFILPSIISALKVNSILPTSLNSSLGINCRGSILCPTWMETSDYIGTFIKITHGNAPFCPPSFSCGPMNDTDIYLPNDDIVCLPLGRSFLGGICAFTQGRKVPATGIVGALIKRKLQELSGHGCRVCGSVPLSENNDPGSQGILTVNYIGGVVCRGLCPPKHYHALLQSNADGSWLPVNESYSVES